MPLVRLLTSASLGIALSLFANAQDKSAVFPTNEQMRHLRTATEPHLSPDARQVVLTIHDSTADGGKSHLWLITVDASAPPRQLTFSPDNDKTGERNATWMPDGQSLLFLAHRGEHTVLYRLPMSTGGEAKAFDLKVTPIVDASKQPNALPPANPTPATPEAKPEPIPADVADFAVSPDGHTLALILNDPQTPGEKRQKDAKADASWVDHDAHGPRLYLLDIATEKLSTTAVPADVRSVAWSPDSTHLLTLADGQNDAGDLAPASTAWSLTPSDPSHPTQLHDLPATTSAAVWTADNLGILYLAASRQQAPPGYADLYEYALASKQTRDLSDGFLGTVGRGDPISLRSGEVDDIAEKGFDVVLARFLPGKAAPDLLHLPLASIHAAETNLAETGWVFLASSTGHPTQLFFSPSLTAEPRNLPIPALVPADIRTTAAQRVHWQSDHLTIEGLLFLPPDATPTHKVPLIVEVHGGPTGAYTDTFSPFDDFLLGHGWAILQTNPRGSTAYGAAFAAANRNDLGGGDLRDILSGVDATVKTQPVDPDRLALMGYSYGGEMAGFAEVKTTRFKAIVSMAPVIDQHSEYGTESSSLYDRWFYGKPWEHPEDAWRQSPLSGVAHARTPFLLLQGESDTTDPLGQSQEMYRALRQAGVPVDLVTYPRVDHGPLARALYGYPSDEPWHGFDARQRIVTFLEKSFASSTH